MRRFLKESKAMSASSSPGRSLPQGVQRETPRSTPATSAKETPTKQKASDSKSSKKPTKQQLEKWTSSINTLLSDDEGIDAFEDFLRTTELVEDENTKYIQFFRKGRAFEKKVCSLEKEALEIYETYLEVGSDKQVSTGGSGSEVGEKMKEQGFPQKTLFDESLQKVKDKLSEAFYAPFCKHLIKEMKDQKP